MYSVRTILDSINPAGKRLTTFLCTYPLNVHAELMTHRVFSRNAASARAIPIDKFIATLQSDPALPVVWRANQRGMEAAGDLDVQSAAMCERVILEMRDEIIKGVKQLQLRNLHKSWVNRYMQPWMWMTTLVTACDFGNWFDLRADGPAQPEIMVVAYWMLKEYLQSQPLEIFWEDWHIPGLEPEERKLYSVDEQLKISTARAARTSYTKFDEPILLPDAIRIHDGMVTSGHWSPFEHCAQAIDVESGLMGEWRMQYYPWSNFDVNGHCSGWGQYRKTFGGEFRKPSREDLQKRLDKMPDWVYNVISQCSK